MVEATGGQRLALRPRRVAAVRGRDHLHRHRAPEALVGRGEDRSEAAGAESRPEPVAAEDELGADFGGQLVRGVHQTCVRHRTVVPSEGAVILEMPNGPEETQDFVLLRRGRRTSTHDAHSRAPLTAPAPRPGGERRIHGRPDRAGPAHGRRASSARLLLLVLIFVVRACNNSRHKDALRNYNLQVSGIATESRQTGEQFFEAMNQGGAQAPADLYQQIDPVQELGRQVARAGARPGRARTTWRRPSSRC